MTDSIQSLPQNRQLDSAISPENRQPPEIFYIHNHYTNCDGGGQVNPAQGHPRVYLTIPHEVEFVDCPYCDRRFQMQAFV